MDDGSVGQLVARGYANGDNIPLEQVLGRVRDGEVIVLPRAMQSLGLFQRLYDLTLDAVRAASSDSHAKRVEDQGIEHIHRILSPRQIVETNVGLSSLPNMEFFGVARRCIEDGLGYRDGYYICSKPIVRTMVPFDLSDTEDVLSTLHTGRIRALSPHRDSWYPHPEHGINIWSAMGRVSRGNGMIIYPDMWRLRIPFAGIHMAKDQPVGRVMNFSLEPGDILLFNGEHLHSTELNVTDETRYVIGTRVTLDQPKYHAEPPWVPYYQAASLEGPVAPLYRLRPYLRPPYLTKRYVRFRIGRVLRKLNLMPKRKNAPVRTAPKSSSGSENVIRSDLGNGEIRAIDDARIAVRIGEEVSVLSRYCVHQGADLAQGYVSEGRLYCPWHNLCFDPKTGRQPCKSLGHLRRFAE
ncbi:MAG: Rieske 2Fe-2S domain-containing protein [Alphaproteobacteria bacterium]|nr:Rieske 2Fe-2S domain-containing protein [Alphaproteobacteria bacterium]